VSTRHGFALVPGQYFESKVIEALTLNLRTYERLAVPTPLLFLATLDGVGGAYYAVRENAFWVDGRPAFHADRLELWPSYWKATGPMRSIVQL